MGIRAVLEHLLDYDQLFWNDFHQPNKIKGIDLGFLHEPSSWIHLPKKIMLSTDQKKYQEFTVNDQRSSFKLRTKAQKIHLKIIGIPAITEGFPGAGNTPWILMDEIIVR